MNHTISTFLFSITVLVTLTACGDKHEHHHKSKEQDKTEKVENVELKSSQAIDAISVINPYIRAMPPGQTNTAMYMQLKNASKIDHDLIKVEGDISKLIELHTHTNDNGVMRMGQVPSIPVPAGQMTEAKSGSYHVMIMNLKQDLKLGEKFTFTLTFKDGTQQSISAEVKEISVEENAHKHL